jgi:hypothetical protein
MRKRRRKFLHQALQRSLRRRKNLESLKISQTGLTRPRSRAGMIQIESAILSSHLILVPRA